jgi:hypothetical protein
MGRDYLKDSVYFEDYIATTNKRIDKFMATADQLSDAQVEQRKKCLGVVAGLERNLINAFYSAGRDKTETTRLVKEYINIVNEVGVHSYNEYVDILSLKIIFGITERLVTDCSGFEDDLTAYLRAGDAKKMSNLKYGDYYGIFADYAMGQISDQAFVTYMENEWYDKCSDFSWFDTHKSKDNIYMGYWSWLAAAIIKMKSAKMQMIKYVPMDFI